MGSGEELGKLRCPALNHIAGAVQEFRRGQQVKALAKARAAVDLAVFGEEGITEESLLKREIDPTAWKALAVGCLLKADAIDSELSLHQWQTVAGTVMDEAIKAFKFPQSITFCSGKLKPHNLTGKERTSQKADVPYSTLAPRQPKRLSATEYFCVETVHSVKGETHDVTIFVCPEAKVSKEAKCPSMTWWSTDAAAREERRIAYVAMTRSRGDLVLCVAESCFKRLSKSRGDFLGAFQHVSIDECIAALSVREQALSHSGVDEEVNAVPLRTQVSSLVLEDELPASAVQE